MADLGAALDRLQTSTQDMDVPDPALPNDDERTATLRRSLERLQRDKMIETDPDVASNLGKLARFTGQGILAGVAEDIGFPIDSMNLAASYTKTRLDPEQQQQIQRLIAAGKLKPGPRRESPIGGGQSVKNLFNDIGAPTASPEEEGAKGKAAEMGYTFGEFFGANAALGPFTPEVKAGKTILNYERVLQSKAPFKAAVHDAFFGGFAPASGAILGEEIAGPSDKDTGKTVGAVLGGARLIPVEGAFRIANKSGHWMYDFLGLGEKGAERKVGKALVGSARDFPEALSNIKNAPEMSPGAQVPLDLQSMDDGIISLRRTVMANDARMSGDYLKAQKATQQALLAEKKFSPANYPDVRSYLAAKRKDEEHLIQRRLEQAVEQAERDTETAVRGIEPSSRDANLAKNRYATELRKQLLFAQDEMDHGLVQARWGKVDKELPVEMHAVYDDIATMRAEHAERIGQGKERFPDEVFGRFFEKKVDAAGKTVEVPKFGAGTRLQEVIDLDSHIRQQIRMESAQDAPDRVYMSYLTRLSKSLGNVKANLADTSQNVALKQASDATRLYHKTFTSGPVGQVLGHDAAGAPDVFPGDTIKHFLSQGPGGVDNFNALMDAVKQRTGARTSGGSAADMTSLVKKHIRQDFYDHTFTNGSFAPGAARKWMANNAGAMAHPDFDDLHKEFSAAIDSSGKSVQETKLATGQKNELNDVRRNRAALFLDGDPGRLFGGALDAADQHAAFKDLLTRTQGDVTGRASEGLAQMALDHMFDAAMVGDKTSAQLERLNGLKLATWVDENQGAIKALNERFPGIDKRFQRIADTGRALERFQVEPKFPQKDEAKGVNWLRETVARVGGAKLFSHLGGGGGASIQTAAIGSNLFKKMAAEMSPETANRILRDALVDPVLFERITTPITEKNADEALRILHPYFYTMGIPLMQPEFEKNEMPEGAKKAPDGKYYVPDPNRPGKYLRVEQ